MKSPQKNIEDDIESAISMVNRSKVNEHNRKRKIENNENNKTAKRKRKTQKIVKWISIVSILIIGVIFTFASPLFNIKEIKVENNNFLSSEKIISLSRLTKDQNIFRFLKADVEKRLKEEPYIESVTISRELPNTVKLDVKERNRDFSVKFLNGYAFINNQGYILEITEDNAGVTVIEGAETPEENIQPGNRLDKKDLKKLEVVIQVMKIAKENEIADKITSINISDKDQLVLHLEADGKDAYIGDGSNLNTKILYIKEIIEKYEVDKEGTIYVDGDFSNKFKAYFREKV